ncbi:MAG: 1-acyl-sn-glycerol-3-phosphate acyltransferase [Bacteroidales bacterium]|nr:1-acyl-sn-glycerol-3-phosphate acyltransferase [Bacteroidales bacterium]
MAREHIYDPDLGYTVFRWYVNAAVLSSYRRFKVIGRENCPKDGSIIDSPNHANCLMDALVILRSEHRATCFVARADIFRNPKVAKFLTFLRIMPIMRKRDGLEEVAKNDEIIENSIQILRHGMPFCIMPEGAHQAKHSMLPLGKGIFRIALGTLENFDDKLYIQPIGLEYTDYFHFRNDLLITYGRPIDITAVKAENPDTPAPVLINQLKAELTERIRELILYIPNDEWYDASYLIASARSESLCQVEALKQKRAVAAEIASLREAEPEKALELLSKADSLAKECIEKDVDMVSVSHRKLFGVHILRAILTIILSPYILACALLSSPVTLIGEKVARQMKDKAFRNSIRCGVLLTWPVFLLIYAILLFVFLPWHCALGTLLLIAPAVVVTHDAIRAWRILISDIRLRTIPNFRKRLQELL